MGTQTTDEPAEAPAAELPATLAERATDQKLFFQAAHGLSCLERDLRFLIDNAPGQVDDSAVKYAAEAYVALREAVLGTLDDASRAAAIDEKTGMPEMDENPTLARLLLKLSQATRFTLIEENWPELFVGTMTARRERTMRLQAIEGASHSLPERPTPTALDLMRGAGNGVSTGYI